MAAKVIVNLDVEGEQLVASIRVTDTVTGGIHQTQRRVAFPFAQTPSGLVSNIKTYIIGQLVALPSPITVVANDIFIFGAPQ